MIGERRPGNKVAAWAERGMRILHLPAATLAEARGNLLPWVPVGLAIGIGLWFAAPAEPTLAVYAGLGAISLAAVWVGWTSAERLGPVAIAVLCLSLGLIAAGARAHLVAAPVLDFRYYGPITGRIIEIDRSQTDALRLTLDQVVLDNVPPENTPVRVRISLRGKRSWLSPEPGQVIQTTGHLSGPEGPVEPGDFDFRRVAWFQRLGAVGYTPHPVLLLSGPGPSEQWIARLRAWFSRGIQAHVAGDPGAFASGVMTGDRSGLSLTAVEDLRASSLAHLLAISGMNLAFLIGFVFMLIRSVIAVIPMIALRINAKKIAAVVSLFVAWFYMLLSGANVATERAFLMVVVMLGAVLFDRRALSMRSVAISATVLLVVRPESLLDPGFQMSFAATAALIAGFAGVERGMLRGRLPRWIMPVFTLVLSSVLAGAATAPFGAAHFGRIADFGLIANLLTVPVMGAVVMPAGAVAALLAPFGLAAIPLWIMGLGCQWILYVASVVAAWDGAVTAVPAPRTWVLAALGFAAVLAVLPRGRTRLLAILPLTLAFVFWPQVRPQMLISSDGRLVGILGQDGRALSSARGAGFAATSWLENDGDLADQEKAALRPGFAGQAAARSFQIGAWNGVLLRGKAGVAMSDAMCAQFDMVISSEPNVEPDGPCRLIGPELLGATGGLAASPSDQDLILIPSRSGARIWSPQDLPADTVMRLSRAKEPGQ